MKLTQCRLCLQKPVGNLIQFVFYPRPPCSELFHAIFDSWPLYQSKNRINYRKTPFLVTKRSQKSYPNILYVFWFVTLKLWVVSLIFLTHVHFMKQKTEKRKIPFLVTKRGQKSYQIWFFDLRRRNCGWFHLLFSTHNHFIKPKIEKRKIPFLVTKSNQKFNVTNFPDLGPPNSWLVNIILIENDLTPTIAD